MPYKDLTEGERNLILMAINFPDVLYSAGRSKYSKNRMKTIRGMARCWPEFHRYRMEKPANPYL